MGFPIQKAEVTNQAIWRVFFWIVEKLWIWNDSSLHLGVSGHTESKWRVNTFVLTSGFMKHFYGYI